MLITIYKKAFIVMLSSAMLMACSESTENPDLGKLEGATYSNNYFGFVIKTPTDWHPLDKEEMNQIINAGKQRVSGGNKNMEDKIDVAMENTFNLFHIFKESLAASASFNPSISCMAERISQFPGIKTSNDYIENMKLTMGAAAMPINFSEVTAERIGGVEFMVMPVEITFGAYKIKQEVYVTMMKGFALSFLINYADDDHYQVLQQALATLNFQ